MSLLVEQTDDGAILPVHAQPGAKKNAITGIHDGAVKVSVTQAPEKGKANQALAKVLASELRLKKSQVSLVSGRTSTRKRFLIKDVELTELLQLISDAAGID